MTDWVRCTAGYKRLLRIAKRVSRGQRCAGCCGAIARGEQYYATTWNDTPPYDRVRHINCDDHRKLISRWNSDYG